MRSSNEFALFCYSYFQFNMGGFFLECCATWKWLQEVWHHISRIWTRVGVQFTLVTLQFAFMGNVLLSIIINMYITIFKILCKSMGICECPQKNQLNVWFRWNQTCNCLALSSDFSDTPNSAWRWHSAQEKKTVFQVELKIAVNKDCKLFLKSCCTCESHMYLPIRGCNLCLHCL